VASATDRANELAVEILPFIFCAKNDTDESVSEEFSKTWTENTGGSGVVKLYLAEIVQLTTASISSARWSTRQTCAFALAEAAKSICEFPILGEFMEDATVADLARSHLAEIETAEGVWPLTLGVSFG